jgi:Fe2+ transport system protein FeoA
VQGLIIGTNVYVKQNLSGNIIVEFNNLNLAIGKDLATNILVETV